MNTTRISVGIAVGAPTVEPYEQRAGHPGVPFIMPAGIGSAATLVGTTGNGPGDNRALLLPPDKYVHYTGVNVSNVRNGRKSAQKKPSSVRIPGLR